MTEDEFENHPLWAEVDACQEILARTDTATEFRSDSERIRWLASQTKKYKSSDWRFFSAVMLQSVHGPWSQAHATLQQVASGSVDSMPAAREQAEACLAHLVSFQSPGARRGGGGKTEKAFFDDYEKSVTASLSTLDEQIRKLLNEATQRDTEHATAVTEMGERISTLTTTVDEQTKRITAASDSLDSKVASIETAAAEAQTVHGDEFREWINARETEWVNERAQPIVDEIQAKNEAAAIKLSELESLSGQIEKVAGKTASAVLARGYGSYSTREWVTGLIAYVIGIGLLVGVGVYLLMTVGDVTRETEISWQYIALKLGLTLTVLAASTVLFQVGRQSLRQSNENKKTELELRAIGPFLADLDDETAVKEAKIDFLTRSFGRGHDDRGKRDSDVVDVSLLEKLIKMLSK